MAQPDARQRAGAAAGEPLAGDRDRARVGCVEPAEQMQQRRFAAAGAAEHGDDLVGVDRQLDAVEQPPRGAADADGLDKALGTQRGHQVTVPGRLTSGPAAAPNSPRRKNPAPRTLDRQKAIHNPSV